MVNIQRKWEPYLTVVTADDGDDDDDDYTDYHEEKRFTPMNHRPMIKSMVYAVNIFRVT